MGVPSTIIPRQKMPRYPSMMAHRGSSQRTVSSGNLTTSSSLLVALAANAKLRPGIGSQPLDVNVIATMITNTEVAVVYTPQGGVYLSQQPGFAVLHAVRPFTGGPHGGKISLVLGVLIVDMDF
jgi:hypothetical protein